MKRFLFVCGCPRSGTTELTRLLNQHSDIYLGCERYLYRYAEADVGPKDFSPESFSRLKEGETFYNSLNEMEGWLHSSPPHSGLEKIKTARILGDKAPSLIYDIARIKPAFPPDTLWIIAIRDILSVIRSWVSRAENPSDSLWRPQSQIDDAIIHWSSSLCTFIELQAQHKGLIDIYMPYIYKSDRAELSRMLHMLDIAPDMVMKEYIDGSIHWRTQNPNAAYLAAKVPSSIEREKILSHSYIRTAVQSLTSSHYRLDLDQLFWKGFAMEFDFV